jgi:hypothetical protein
LTSIALSADSNKTDENPLSGDGIHFKKHSFNLVDFSTLQDEYFQLMEEIEKDPLFLHLSMEQSLQQPLYIPGPEPPLNGSNFQPLEACPLAKVDL